MRRLRIFGVALASSVAVVLATALPAAASWHRTTNAGSPGYVTNVDTPGAQGGICGLPATGCPRTDDQIFIDRYRAWTAPYSAYQTMTSTAYLYYSNGQTWVLYATHSEGSCYGPGNGSSYCTFGSPAPDLASGGSPAFINMPQGWKWTLVVRVSWYNYNTGALLAQADYRPTYSYDDLDCASFATTYERCSGPLLYNGVTYLNMPVGRTP